MTPRRVAWASALIVSLGIVLGASVIGSMLFALGVPEDIARLVAWAVAGFGCSRIGLILAEDLTDIENKESEAEHRDH